MGLRLDDLGGMDLGEQRRETALARVYRVGEVLFDSDPYHYPLKVVQASRPYLWDEDLEEDVGGFAPGQAGSIATDLVLERVERSPEGAEYVGAYQAYYGSPIQQIGSEIRVNGSVGGGAGRVSRLASRSGDQRKSQPLPPVRVEPSGRFDENDAVVVYDAPGDGWYETTTVTSLKFRTIYYFQVRGGVLVEAVANDALRERLGLRWYDVILAGDRFRAENGTSFEENQ